MILFVLGVLDVLIGTLLWMSSGNPFTTNAVVLIFAVIWMLKGAWSILSSASVGWFFDYMGIPDLLAGMFLLFSYFGMSFGFFFYLAIIMLAKGLWSFLMGMRA